MKKVTKEQFFSVIENKLQQNARMIVPYSEEYGYTQQWKTTSGEVVGMSVVRNPQYFLTNDFYNKHFKLKR